MEHNWDSDDFVLTLPKTKDMEKVEDMKESSNKPVLIHAGNNKNEVTSLTVKIRETKAEDKNKHDLDLNITSRRAKNKSLDKVSFNTRQESFQYANRLSSKINDFHSQSCYQEFLEDLFKSLSKDLSADSVKKISNSFKAFSDKKIEI